MEITVALLKKNLKRLRYVWYTDRPNIIGIRTTIQVPDVFNDLLALIWTQQAMPTNYSLLNKQKWLNKWKYLGKNGKPLAEDGIAGANTDFALATYNATVGKERMKLYLVTTEPGVYYQKTPLNSAGCAIIKPGQYKDAYGSGYHQGKTDHRCLRQNGNITVYRDNDKDGVAENLGVEETGNSFGCNIHGAKKFTKTEQIGPWSAGCQVFADWYEKEEFVDLCDLYKTFTGNKFTYTLVREDELLA
jgi:hypothetical protein